MNIKILSSESFTDFAKLVDAQAPRERPFLLADTVTGVWAIGSIDGEEAELLSQQDFLDALSRLKDDTLIATQPDAEFWAVIDAEYGIDTTLTE